MNRPTVDRSARLVRARKAMDAGGVDVLLLSVGTDLPYLIGYEAMPSERLTMAVIPAEGSATLLVPELEAPRVEIDPELCSVLAWGEQERPVELVGAMIAGAATAAIGDHTWSRFLLALQDEASAVRFVPASGITGPLRTVKDDAETELLAAAGAAADRVAARLAGERFSGRTERQLAAFVSTAVVEEGHDDVAFAIVASGPNGASPHHEPGDRVIETGDTVVVDFGGRIGGYHSDTTRTFAVGPPTAEVAAAHASVAAAQQAGIDAVRPGVPATEIDEATRAVLTEAGLGRWFVHRTGHGIGLDVHEDPYLVAGNHQVIHRGMAFSVEPGVYLPGRFGVRIEDIVVVTDDGARRLNESSRDLIVVD